MQQWRHRPAWLVSIGAGIITGGAAGYLSSVYAAGPAARRQEAVRRRMRAQEELHQTASTYLGRLDIGRPGKRGPQSPYADGYADLAGREELALDVTRLLPGLPRRSQQRIRTILQVRRWRPASPAAVQVLGAFGLALIAAWVALTHLTHDLQASRDGAAPALAWPAAWWGAGGPAPAPGNPLSWVILGLAAFFALSEDASFTPWPTTGSIMGAAAGLAGSPDHHP